MPNDKIIVIGSGMTGLSCARRLVDAGAEVTILDKGRSIGGRLATRRTREGWQFDHGAQYVTAHDPGFQAVLQAMHAAGAADVWDDGASEPHMVGVPGMNALAQHLSTGLEVRQDETVLAIGPSGQGWSVVTESDREHAARVVITIPAPQIPNLIGPDHPLAKRIVPVEMTPCLTLMAAFGDDQPIPFTSRRDPDDALSWISYNSAKPGRSDPGCWVAQASVRWTTDNLERERDELAHLMVPMLCERIGADPDAVLYAAAHRWRYANVKTPLGAPFLRDSTESLYLGGDWCQGPRVEAAWTCGRAIADDILGHA